MKKILFYFLMLATMAMIGCKDDNKPAEENNSIVGSWIGCNTMNVEEGYTNLDSVTHNDCFIYLRFGSDNTFMMYMPAWWESRTGTYSVNDNTITIDIDNIECKTNEFVGPAFHDHPNGHLQDMYGCATMAEWIAQNPEEAHFSISFTFDGGHLIFAEGPMGMPLTCVRDNNNIFNIIAYC